MAAKSFQVALDAAANETNIEENWDRILEVCDFVRNGQVKANDLLDQILKRLKQSRKTRLQLNTLILFDAAVKNCGQQFHQLFTSRATMNTLVEIIEDARTETIVRNRIGSLLKQWMEDPEFKDKPQYAMLGATYKRLVGEKGYSFIDGVSNPSASSGPTATMSVAARKAQDELLAKREEEEFAKAIALSIQEANQSKSHSTSSATASSSIYPSMQTPSTATAPVASPAVNGHEKKVKALYDFEAAEDNEVTFKAGDILTITDDSDQHWWKGINNGVEGLFPANFVTKNLQQPVETAQTSASNMNKVSNESNQAKERQDEVLREQVVIDEQLIDRCLAMLQNADPTGELEPDSNEMLTLEDTCYAMGPLIDHELEKVDRKHMQLEELNKNLREAMDLYHRLMEEGRLRAAQVKSTNVAQLGTNPMYPGSMAPQAPFYPSMHPTLNNQSNMVPPAHGLTQPMMYPPQAQYTTMPGQTQQSMSYMPPQASGAYYVDPNLSNVPTQPIMYSMPPNMMNHHLSQMPASMPQSTTHTETQ